MPPPHPHLRRSGALVLIVLIAWLAYANSLQVPFVFDDELAIVQNPSIRSLSTALFPPPELGGLPISGRPIVNASFALNHGLSGYAVPSYHVINVLIHAGCGLLLFGIVRRTVCGRTNEASAGQESPTAGNPAMSPIAIALWTTVLWVVHPLQTESVTYISQRAESLLAWWYLLTLYAFIRGAASDRPWRWYTVAAMSCWLGAFTKEVIVSAPLCVLVYARTFLCRGWRETWRTHRGALLAIASGWLPLAAVVFAQQGARGQSAGFGLGVSAWHYLLTQCEAIVLYLKLSVWPHPLVLDYGTGVVDSLLAVWWQALLLLGLFVAALLGAARGRALGWIALTCFMVLAPSSSVIPLVGQTMAEHRMYLPLAGVVAIGVLGVNRLCGPRAVWILTAIAIAFTALTTARNQDYASTVRIMTDTVTKQPTNGRAMALLADYHQREGQLDEARRWLERSLAVEPGRYPVLSNLGDVSLRLGKPADAIRYFEAALAIRPSDARVRNNLGNALIASGRIDDGLQELAAAVAAAPADTAVGLNYAQVQFQAGRHDAALALLERLARENPRDVEIRLAYADALTALRDTPRALEQLEAAARLSPDDASVRTQLGVALGRSGRLREALEQFETALRLDPSNAAARQNADIARRRLGQ